jgi:hypothetical protein
LDCNDSPLQTRHRRGDERHTEEFQRSEEGREERGPGLAEARMEVRALRVAMMPAFVMETVCCSIASWRIALLVHCQAAESQREERVMGGEEGEVPGGVAHFVELIDAADAVVRQNQSTRFQNHITGLRVSERSKAGDKDKEG